MAGLENTAWILNRFCEEGTLTDVIPGTKITAYFSGKQSINGSSGCNTYGGDAAYPVGTDTGSLAITDMFTTLMLCHRPLGIMEQEFRYAGGLARASHFEIDGGTLTLSWNKGQSSLIFGSVESGPHSTDSETEAESGPVQEGRVDLGAIYDPRKCGCDNLGYELQFVSVGTSPRAIAVTQDDKKVYVVCDDGVRVIDIATLATTSLTAGAQPMGIVMHPSQPRAYVANFGSRNITQYDTSAGTLLPAALEVPVTGPVGKMQPASLAINPSGTKLFVNSSNMYAHGGMAWLDLGGAGTVHVVEEPSLNMSISAGLNFASSPYRAAAREDDETFLALEHRPNRLRFVNTVLNSVIDHEIDPLPCAVIAAGGGDILVSGYKENGPRAEDAGIDIFRKDIAQVPFWRAYHIDTPSYAMGRHPYDRIPYEGYGHSIRAVAIEPKSGRLWYGNVADEGFGVGHVGIVDRSSGQFQTFAFKDCQGIAFTSDGKYAFLSDTRNNRVARLKLF
jgi:DNA-binding beta-propeller fold protein YncE